MISIPNFTAMLNWDRRVFSVNLPPIGKFKTAKESVERRLADENLAAQNRSCRALTGQTHFFFRFPGRRSQSELALGWYPSALQAEETNSVAKAIQSGGFKHV